MPHAARRSSQKVIHVIQGDYHVSDDPDVVLGTILGSCVATCLWDAVSGVGGMNHFLLPEGNSRETAHFRYGLHAMELLINGLLKTGARRDRLKAKLFGGAAMHDGLARIGEANGRFARDFLEAEGIPCIADSLGGTRARRLRFTPVTGQARQLLLEDNSLAPPLPPSATPRSQTDDITFF